MGQLTIRSISEVKEASDTRKYFTLKLAAGLGQAEHTRNIFEDFVRDAEGNNTSTKVWKRGTYAEFKAAMEAGEKIEGAIETRKVETYKIRENAMVDSYTCIVFADEKVEAVFAANNHPILDEQTGELIGKKKEKVVLATDESKSENVLVK